MEKDATGGIKSLSRLPVLRSLRIPHNAARFKVEIFDLDVRRTLRIDLGQPTKCQSPQAHSKSVKTDLF